MAKPKQNWVKMFEELDTGKDGLLSVEELKIGLEARNIHCSNYSVESALGSLDENKDGKVTKAEFVAAMSKTSIHDPGELKAAFKEFDKDNSGFITKCELKDAMKKMGVEISDEDLDNMMKGASKDGDNKISFDEFVTAMQ